MVRGVREQGFTLIEVLIAVLVLAIGLLGLAGLQASALRVNHDAQLRSQATLLAYDMADRMRTNRELALSAANPYDTAYVAAGCVQGFVPTGATIALQDLEEWRNQLACYLPRGEGEVIRDLVDDVFTINVRWNEREDGDPDNLRVFSFQMRLR